MTIQEILAKNIKNGQFFGLETITEKTRKGITYRKQTSLTAQYGVNYANVSAIQDKLNEQGGVKPTWFEHTEHDGIVKSKKDASKLYLQIMNPSNIKTLYFMADGTPTTKAELVTMGAIKDEPSKDEKIITLCFALENVKNIIYKAA